MLRAQLNATKSESIKAITKKAIPLAFLFGTNAISAFLRTILIAQQGKDELTSMIIADNITNLVIYPVPQLLVQDSVFVAELFGQIDDCAESNDDHDELYSNNTLMIGDLLRQGWLLSILTSIISASVLAFFGPVLVQLFNESDSISSDTENYLRLYAPSFICLLMNEVSQRFLASVNQEKWLMPYRILGLCTEAGFNYLLISKYALNGVAYSSIISSLLNLLMLICFFIFHPQMNKKMKIFRWSLGDKKNFVRILSQGWPLFVNQFANAISSYALTLFIASLGNSRLNANAVVGQWSAIAMIASLGISESANRIVAQKYGSQKYHDMKQAGDLSLLMNSIYYVVMGIVMSSFSEKLASLFLSESDINENLTMIKSLFYIVSLYNLANGLMQNGVRIVEGTEDTLLGAILNLFTNVGLILPLSAIITYLTKFDIYGIAITTVLARSLTAIPLLRYWSKRSSEFKDSEDVTELETSNVRYLRYARGKISNCCSSLFSSNAYMELADPPSSEAAYINNYPN